MKQMNDTDSAVVHEKALPLLLDGAVNKKRKFRFKELGIKLQLIIGFFLFTVVIVVVLWVFQVLLLNTFYESIKTAEVKAAAEQLSASIEDQDATIDLVIQLFKDNIYVRISDELGLDKLQSYISSDTLAALHIPDIYMLGQFELLEIYTKLVALKEPYVYIGPSNSMRGKNTQTITYMVTVQIPGGVNRLIMLETEITPLDATVKTLKVQLTWLTVLMAIMGMGLALYIANRISKPIVSINESAKVLAGGNYNIRFEEAGTKETTELGHTLNYAAKELSKVENLRRELIANVSHDLRTPLTMIKGYSEVMRDLPGENTPENAQILIDEASRLADLVNDMLDLSKLESGTIPLKTERYNLTHDLREVLKRYEKLADFAFTLEAEEDVYVQADELKISQVVYNLINNAINYSLDDKRIALRQIKMDRHVRIEIADHGEGIPGDKLKDIWDRYYKIDKEHKRAQVGTGLGLSIVKNILDMHGGTYGVRSKEGVGSTFWFELPLDTSADSRKNLPETPETQALPEDNSQT